MPEFDQIHLNAKELYNRITGNPSAIYSFPCKRNQHYDFFNSRLTSQDLKTEKDARIVSFVAISLNKKNDGLFNQFLDRFPTSQDHRIRCYKQFQEIKKQILIGCYLMHLHNAVLDKNKLLIELFCKDLEINQKDLEINKFGNYKREYIDSCFTWFSCFCGFVFQYNEEDNESPICADYNNLISHLPSDIQILISNAKFGRAEQKSVGLDDVLSMGLTMLSSLLPLEEEPHAPQLFTL